MTNEIIDAAEEPTTDPVLLDSILDTIKKMIGLASDYDAFDTDVIIHINSAFFTLYQLGVGVRPIFSISDSKKTWIEFSDDSSIITAVKQYIYLKVRMAFDPPSASSVLNQYSASIQELEWRIRELADGIFDEEPEDGEVTEPPSDEPTNPDTPVEPGQCGCPDVATDEEVDSMLDGIFGDSSVPPGSDIPITPGECGCPDIATNEEVDEMLEEVYGDSSIPVDQDIATDEEVEKILDDAFGDDSIASDEEVETILNNIFGG